MTECDPATRLLRKSEIRNPKSETNTNPKIQMTEPSEDSSPRHPEDFLPRSFEFGTCDFVRDFSFSLQPRSAFVDSNMLYSP
jgi:hypothetical protein